MPKKRRILHAPPGVTPALADLCRRIGAAIRVARHDSGYTQARLASALGLSSNLVTHLERGSRKPSFATLYALSTTLKVPLERLIAPEPEPRIAAKRGASPHLGHLGRVARDLDPAQVKLLLALAADLRDGARYRASLATGRKR